MKLIKWDEPGDNNCCIPAEEAIILQKAAAAREGHTYINDEQALEDFITIHWAWVIDETNPV